MIRCPCCAFKIDVKGAPGVYQPHCPQCKERFVLVVPREADRPTLVARSLAELKSQHDSPSATEAATVAPSRHAPRAAPHAPAAAVAPPAPAPDSSTQPTLSGAGAATPAASPSQAQTVSHDAGLPLGRLDGFELIRLIGRGGMGRVYLARQISLDRMVAIKTIDPHLSQDPAFLARFVREAYAVAQLSHHNVVQIHDIGQADDTHFFSMEYVAGQSLTELIKAHGKLDPEQAATYVLHAARGLKFAHEHHMVHRDVKPSNLLLNDQGLVKVADLGLVKLPDAAGEPVSESGRGAGSGSRMGGSSMTVAAGTIGTPAYMAPEQGRDAASVDARADIYALGATFYHMVTGRPPFEGQTTEVLLQQHASAAVTPPQRLAPRLSQPMSAMILRMLAKNPDDRYQDMGEVVAALETCLGIEAGPFTPRREHSAALEQAVAGFNKATAARTRSALIVGFHAVAALVLAIGAIVGDLGVMGGVVGLWASTVAAYVLLSGLLGRSVLVTRLRQYVFTFGLRQWLAAAGGVAVFAAMAVALDLHWLYLGAIVAGAGIAVGMCFTIDVWTSRQRKPYVEGIRQMLKDMRLRGLEEEALRRFVCRYSGRHWEGFYEALFGYAAKIEARRHWGRDMDDRPRPRHAAWRDGLIDWLDLRLREREESRQRRYLQRVELQRLRAQGVSDLKAAAESRRATDDLVDRAHQYRTTGKREVIAAVVRNRALTAAEKAQQSDEDEGIPESWKLRPTPVTTRTTHWVLGAPGRFAVGAALFAVWALWARQRGALPAIPSDGGYFRYARMFVTDKPEALHWPGVPDAIMNTLCSPTAGLAGLILMLSVLFRGRKMTVFLLPVVVLLLRAPFMAAHGGWILSPYEWTVAIALALVPPAYFLGRSRY